MQTNEGLKATLQEISKELGSYAFFQYSNLISCDMHTKEHIAVDYLMSQKGCVSRYMAEEGCFRVPKNAPQQVMDAMRAYMKLIQDNILKKSGTTIWIKEVAWKTKEKNYVWCRSPADPDYWTRGDYLTSGYKCTYRTKGMFGLGAQE